MTSILKRLWSASDRMVWFSMLTRACSVWIDWCLWAFFCVEKELAQQKKEWEPVTVSEVRSYLEFPNYSSSLIPFHFPPEQNAAFGALKESMAEVGTLAYFDKDASPVGLGAVSTEPEWSVGADLLCKLQPHNVWTQIIPDRKIWSGDRPQTIRNHLWAPFQTLCQ